MYQYRQNTNSLVRKYENISNDKDVFSGQVVHLNGNLYSASVL